MHLLKFIFFSVINFIIIIVFIWMYTEPLRSVFSHVIISLYTKVRWGRNHHCVWLVILITPRLKEVISTTRPHSCWFVELALNAVFLSSWRFWDRVFKVFLCSTGCSGGTCYVAQTDFELVMVLLVLFLVLCSQVYIVTLGCVASFLRDFQNTHQSSRTMLHSHQE